MSRARIVPRTLPPIRGYKFFMNGRFRTAPTSIGGLSCGNLSHAVSHGWGGASHLRTFAQNGTSRVGAPILPRHLNLSSGGCARSQRV